MKRGKFRVGTSGYQYDHWVGVLYDKDTPKKDWFSRYAEVFDTVEINSTFYSLPHPKTFDTWRERAPKGFLYVLKFSRYGSHLKRLKSPEDTIGKFLGRASRLGTLLGPILVQLPPNWNADPERLESFLEAAPEDRRWAVEFRDKDWLKPQIFDILRNHDAALCIHDMIDDHPDEITTDWVYLRFHGENYDGSYSHRFLTARAEEIGDWLDRGLDVFAFFNNDAHGYAVENARDLKRSVEERERRGQEMI
jgi:uncharacterized protein YecE (DUF72 family)